MKLVMTLLSTILPMLLGMLTKEQGKKFLDGLFDYVEDWVTDSENAIDDMIVLPLVRKLREILDIPDLPDIDDTPPPPLE